MKLWTGRFSKEAARVTGDFNSSIAVDARLARADIAGSLAHAEMLARQGIISPADGEAIRAGLESILADLESGALAVDMEAEDIHTFVETELTRRIGEAGKR
ncbi:MAG: lyase family protein, partial [Oscillospiraceae bacterium]|nr:lyase family protein [Oscillospiraceae bacterium]